MHGTKEQEKECNIQKTEQEVDKIRGKWNHMKLDFYKKILWSKIYKQNSFFHVDSSTGKTERIIYPQKV